MAKQQAQIKKVLLPLAPGFEEIEALAVVDILRRAGVDITLAGTVSGPIEGRNKIKVLADTTMDSIVDRDFDMIVLPGGAQGTENLKRDARIRNIVKQHFIKGKTIAAICAAPTVLSDIGITKGRTVTCHPTVKEALKAEIISNNRVVVDGNIVTSQGLGTALEFAFKLVELLFGKDKVHEINKGVLARL